MCCWIWMSAKSILIWIKKLNNNLVTLLASIVSIKDYITAPMVILLIKHSYSHIPQRTFYDNGLVYEHNIIVKSIIKTFI